MRRVSIGIVAVVTQLGILPANAGFATGNDILEWCEHYPSTALGYAMAIADEYGVNAQVITEAGEAITPKQFICIPEGVKGGQLKDVVCSYLEGNPGNRHWPGSVLAYQAMLNTWRCPGT